MRPFLLIHLVGNEDVSPRATSHFRVKKIATVEFFGLDADPNKLAATWRVYFDYGCALGDFRAAYKAKGET